MNLQDQTIIKELKKMLVKEFGNIINEVILFGSRAKKSAQPDSDFDILILVNNSLEWHFKNRVSDICYDLELKYDIIADTHLLSVEDLNECRGKQPIFYNAINNGIYA